VKTSNKPLGVLQYFYHCKNEELPVRDVTNSRGHGHKTEPHYENLTENWCSKCMPRRIKSANQKSLDYLFLCTHYSKAGHAMDGKLLVVGFLYRAQKEVWQRLSRSIRSGVDPYDDTNPLGCGFFAGDITRSHFVSAEDAYPLKEVRNPRWKWFVPEEQAMHIISHLKKSRNILSKLRNRVAELKAESSQSQNRYEKRKNTRGCTRC